MQDDRYYHLDLLRAFLMALGVVIHAAFVYITERTWLVADSDTHRFFDYLVFVIHVFRMPAFFFLSGYLFALVLQTQGATTALLRSRLTRLCVPLFTAGVILNVPQLWLFDRLGPDFHGASVVGNSCDTTAQWYAGCWVLHLWFLVALFYFLAIGAFVHWALICIARLWGRARRITFSGPESASWPAIVICFAIVSYGVQSLYWRGGGDLIDWVPLLNKPWFFQYLPFFLVGFLFQRASRGVAAWSSMRGIFFFALAATWGVLVLLFEISGLGRSEFIFSSRNTLLLYYAAAFQTIFALIILASRLPMPTPARAREFADASYTIYLVHHLMIFLLGLWLASTPLPINLKFVLIVSVVLTLSYIFHYFLVSKVPLLRLIFNGRIGRVKS